MKITFVLPMYLAVPSGGFKVVYEYANRLQARGHQITVVHPRNETPQRGAAQFLKSRLWPYKLRLQHRPLIPWFTVHPQVQLKLTPDLRAQFIPEADAIIATAQGTAFPVAEYDARKGRKFYLLQSYETWQAPEKTVRASWQLPMTKIAVSGWLQTIAQELGEAQRTVHIPLGLDFQQFRITTPIADRTRPRVGMLAHPHTNKGLADGLKALQIAKEHFPTLEAVLFGASARPASAPDWIAYVQQPSAQALTALYNGCSIFLSPSWLEGWGLPAAEAMACGCALVSTDNGGVHDFAQAEQTAWLTPIQRPDLLGEALQRLLADDGLRCRLATAGNQQIQQFTWERAIVALERALEGVLAN